MSCGSKSLYHNVFVVTATQTDRARSSRLVPSFALSVTPEDRRLGTIADKSATWPDSRVMVSTKGAPWVFIWLPEPGYKRLLASLYPAR